MTNGVNSFKIVKFSKSKLTVKLNKKGQLKFTFSIRYTPKFFSTNGTNSYYLPITNKKKSKKDKKKSKKDKKKSKKDKKKKKKNGKKLKCSVTLSKTSAPKKKCNIINSKGIKVLRVNKKWFSVCKSKPTAQNAGDVCPGLDPSALDKNLVKKHSLKNLVLAKLRALTK